MEVLNGDMANISAFRFSFWQKIEYYEPTAKFPDQRWQLGRFVGITWDAGDEFTFKLWTEPNGNWKEGSKLTRNKQVSTKKRHRRDRQVVFKLVDIPDLEGDGQEEQPVQEEEMLDSCTDPVNNETTD
eukprot:7165323-Ditylum_brightwellii.AAC.1